MWPERPTILVRSSENEQNRYNREIQENTKLLLVFEPLNLNTNLALVEWNFSKILQYLSTFCLYTGISLAYNSLFDGESYKW